MAETRAVHGSASSGEVEAVERGVDGEAGEGEVEDAFLRESRQVSAEYVRLVLRELEPPLVPLGPDEQTVGTKERKAVSSNVIAMAERVKAMADGMDAEAKTGVSEAIVQKVRAVDVFNFTLGHFKELCNGLFSSFRRQFTSLPHQVWAVFRTTALLVHQLRQRVEERPLPPVLVSRQEQFEGFSGEYFRLSELEPAILRHGGLVAVVGVSLSSVAIPCVEISSPDFDGPATLLDQPL